MRALAALAFLALASSCSRKEPEKLRTEPWENPSFRAPAQPSAPPSSARRRYALTASDLRFSLPAKEQTTSGTFSAASGELWLAPEDLGGARAMVTVDLTSISVSSGSAGGEQPAFTARAREWLELGELVPQAVRERHRAARFELDGVERLLPGKKAGTWQAVARGQLSLHGFRVPVETAIGVELSADKVVVRSLRPLTIKLAEHDLRPRNAEGQFVSSELSLLGTRIGREARVDFELSFTLSP